MEDYTKYPPQTIRLAFQECTLCEKLMRSLENNLLLEDLNLKIISSFSVFKF